MASVLIVVDMQNLFVDLVGDDGPRVLSAVNRQVAAAVARHDPVFYTRDYAPIDLPEGDPESRTDLHPGLDVRGPVALKGPGKQGCFSGFILAPVLEPQQGHGGGHIGPLLGLLRGTAVTSVTVVGIATDICVAATARNAARLGYAVTVPLEATSPVPRRTDASSSTAITELRAAGVTVAADIQHA